MTQNDFEILSREVVRLSTDSLKNDMAILECIKALAERVISLENEVARMGHQLRMLDSDVNAVLDKKSD